MWTCEQIKGRWCVFEDGVLMCACTGPDPEQAAANIAEAMEERFGEKVSPTLAMLHRAHIEAAESMRGLQCT